MVLPIRDADFEYRGQQRVLLRRLVKAPDAQADGLLVRQRIGRLCGNFNCHAATSLVTYIFTHIARHRTALNPLQATARVPV